MRLSRQFAYQAAVAAGLEHCRGDAVAIDADLQDPPELIPRLIEEWQAGSDVVFVVREQREGEGRLKLGTTRCFSALFSKFAEFDVPANAGDFRLLSRRAVEALKQMPERSRFMRGMTVWVGFRQSSVPSQRDPRYAGDTATAGARSSASPSTRSPRFRTPRCRSQRSSGSSSFVSPSSGSLT